MRYTSSGSGDSPDRLQVIASGIWFKQASVAIPIANVPSNVPLTRRHVLGALGLTAAGAVLTACGGSSQRSASNPESGVSAVSPADLERMFAEFEPADELSGRVARMVWPDFVNASPPAVGELDEFHVTSGDLIRYFPCFCGCSASGGHHNNRDCYIPEVHPDGSLTFDSTAPT